MRIADLLRSSGLAPFTKPNPDEREATQRPERDESPNTTEYGDTH
jgi:hypothetical protein